MEFFNKAKAVRLKSHLNKYLVADDDQVTTRQSRSATRKGRWTVELVETNSHVIRLKSCHGRYLTASKEPFLLGTIGCKVVQTEPENIKDFSIEWQPIRDGFQVKLKGLGGSTNNWILWDVEAVEIPENEFLTDYFSMVSSFSSVSDELSGLDMWSPSPESPVSMHSGYSPSFKMLSMKKKSFNLISRTPAMDLFQNSKAVRLRSVHDKYLIAEEDEESVTQERNGSSKNAKWIVEFVENSDNIIRLKSCYNKYLTASSMPFLLGMTGRKVLQTLPGRLDSSVEWEPIREGNSVKLKTRYGQFLRANGGLPPWRNSVTHDIPHRTATQDSILWDVHLVEILVAQSPVAAAGASPPLVVHSDSFASDSSSPSTHSSMSASFSGHESNDSMVSSSPKGSDGRTICFHVANEYGEIDEGFEELGITFKGIGVQELTKRLEEELGMNGIVVCTRSPLNGKLYPLRLQLPPNNSTMHVVVVPTSSQETQDLGRT
ncbi:Actin cross-linking protein [Forsythia ovata]|uniref:Actin cross-linking protein n=1 Tax=Forsythia ovata TaxID=205694 RepID=A0ABD1TBV4_9LAMI